jgi:Fe-S-cluster containining protein
MNDELAEQVRSAAGRPQVISAVRELYDRLQAQVEERKPICVESGKCCRFEEYGHRLYVTTIELAAFVSQLQQIPAEPDRPRSLPIATSPSPGGCPFQTGKTCSVHPIRPFGCRIFYCDPTAVQWQQEKYEQFHSEMKELHERLGIQYFYIEWRQALKSLGLTE